MLVKGPPGADAGIFQNQVNMVAIGVPGFLCSQFILTHNINFELITGHYRP